MKRKIEELFRLAMNAQKKTKSFVYFDISNYGFKCTVSIMDDGFEEGHGFDGSYSMSEEWDERSEEAYQKAKEHLIKLLRTKRKEAMA